MGERRPMRGASGQALVCLPPSNIHMHRYLPVAVLAFNRICELQRRAYPAVRPTCSAPRDRFGPLAPPPFERLFGKFLDSLLLHLLLQPIVK